MSSNGREAAWKNRIVGHGEEDPEQLLANPKNWRIHPDAQQQALKGVLTTVGWVDEVKVNRASGCVVDGHLRVALALRHHQPSVPVKYVELTEAEEDLILATLDPIAAMAKADKQQLDALLHDVQSGDAAVQVMLAELAEQSGLHYGAEPPDDPGAQLDKAEQLQEKWQVRPNDLWVLGSHKLICGDCTDRAVVERVMGGERARLTFTSPPYSKQRTYDIGDFDWLALACGFSDCMFPILADLGDAIVNLGLEYKDGRINAYWDEWLKHCADNGHPLYGWYVWDKGAGFPGEWNGRLAPAHEWLFHFSNGRQSANKWVETTGESMKRGVSGKRFRQRDGSLRELTSPDKIGQLYKIPDSVIRINREMARGIHTEAHPATFPVELSEFGIQTWSNPDDIVFDPFVGSGTTLIACQRLQRRARAIEISAPYCSVVLERWSDMTGQQPERVS